MAQGQPLGIGSPAMQCHEQGWIFLPLGHPVVAYLIRNVIASEARRSRLSIVVERWDCFVAFGTPDNKLI